MSSQRQKTGGTDKTVLRLAVFGILIVACFVALFSRLWFLQVLASEEYRTLAKENRVRFVHSEPPRGRILDRNGVVLVDNRTSYAITVDRQVLVRPRQRNRVLRSIAEMTDEKLPDLKRRLEDTTVSPYKPVAVARDVPNRARYRIIENHEDFPGVGIAKLPVREYPQGKLAAHLLGYVGEISEEQLKEGYFANARPPYAAGDIVGKAGLELTYDRWLRGTPAIEKMVVNSAGDVIGKRPKRAEVPGQDLVLSLDAQIQAAAEDALAAGLETGDAVGGAVTVMDPNTGGIVAMASLPTYDPAILADGITTEEFRKLNDPEQPAFFNRALQGERSPGSTFKIVTAGAALANDIVGPFDTIECPGAAVYPPSGVPGSVTFRNWTSAYNGIIGFPKSLEISCDTFYYELGWRMETAFGPPESAGGDGSERFQKYMRLTGFGHDTGIDLPNEADGRVPDQEWLAEFCEATECLNEDWLPGYTVNMSIGQGDLVTTPLQMAVAFGAIANGGEVLEPRVGDHLTHVDPDTGEATITREIESKVADELPLDDTELGVIHEGLIDVLMGAEGTARGAFAGFPLEQFPIAGKTGTAQIGETDDNDAWFVSYGPSDDPEYVISVYLEKTFGHGGEIAAPVARQIWERIFGIDEETDIQIGQDASG
ncbi:MAG TPA: penicillin-binding protein 2 [Actinomycetota bacterium]|nr:penicillin-binding protein 2 [Actinomycetota bacterium]